MKQPLSLVFVALSILAACSAANQIGAEIPKPLGGNSAVPASTSTATPSATPSASSTPTTIPAQMAAPKPLPAVSTTTQPSPLSTPTAVPSPTISLNPGFNLANCTTSINADAPAFYKTYFACSNIQVNGSQVVLSSQGVPPHLSYYYGSSHSNYTAFDYSRGSGYRPNPNTLSQRNLVVTLPLNPTPKANLKITANLIDGQVGGTYDYPMGPAGMALDGVAMFNPLAAPGDNIENEKYTFDSYNSHPAPGGEYHYHTVSSGPLEVLAYKGLISKTTPGQAEIELYGLMCDGTVVMGCTELDGSKPNTSDFDAQNGHVQDLKGKDGQVMLAGRYHIHLCDSGLDKVRKFTPEIQYYSSCNGR